MPHTIHQLPIMLSVELLASLVIYFPLLFSFARIFLQAAHIYIAAQTFACLVPRYLLTVNERLPLRGPPLLFTSRRVNRAAFMSGLESEF